jgi:hypothetical protein
VLDVVDLLCVNVGLMLFRNNLVILSNQCNSHPQKEKKIDVLLAVCSLAFPDPYVDGSFGFVKTSKRVAYFLIFRPGLCNSGKIRNCRILPFRMVHFCCTERSNFALELHLSIL